MTTSKKTIGELVAELKKLSEEFDDCETKTICQAGLQTSRDLMRLNLASVKDFAGGVITDKQSNKLIRITEQIRKEFGRSSRASRGDKPNNQLPPSATNTVSNNDVLEKAAEYLNEQGQPEEAQALRKSIDGRLRCWNCGKGRDVPGTLWEQTIKTSKPILCDKCRHKGDPATLIWAIQKSYPEEQDRVRLFSLDQSRFLAAIDRAFAALGLDDIQKNAGKTVLTFGKHEGKSISEAPKDYLEWCLGNFAKMDSNIRELINLYLDPQRPHRDRSKEDKAKADDESGRKVADVAAIIVGPRYRQDLGEIDKLAASMDELGQLQPIVIDQEMNLLAGYRRLQAAKLLKWPTIDVNVVNLDGLDPVHNLRIEQAENERRKDFTVSERVAIAKAIEERIGKRQGKRTDKENEADELPQNFGEVAARPGQETKEVAAKAAGFGNPETYRQAEKVVEKAIPEIVEAVDAGDVSVSDAAKVADKPEAVQRQAIKEKKEGKTKTLSKAPAVTEAAKAAEPVTAKPVAPVADQPTPSPTPQIITHTPKPSWKRVTSDYGDRLSDVAKHAGRLGNLKVADRKVSCIRDVISNAEQLIRQWRDELAQLEKE